MEMKEDMVMMKDGSQHSAHLPAHPSVPFFELSILLLGGYP